jgi:hypothetical protein
MILKGLQSGRSTPMTRKDWGRLRDKLRRHQEKK